MENFDRIEFEKERDFSSLLNATFEFLKQEFKPLMKILLVRIAPFLVLIGIFSALSLDNLNNNLSSNPFAIFSIYYIAQMILTLFTVIYIQSLTLHYIKHYNSNSTEPVEEYLKKNAFSKIFNLLGVNIGFYFLVVVGTIFFVIPGIYLFVIYSLSIIITVLGNGNEGVFNKSSDLIKNHWWETFGGLIVIFIIYYILSLIISLPSSIFYFFNAFSGIESGVAFQSSNNLILDIILNIITSFSLISAIIMYIYLSFNYYSLKEQKEATGLLEKIDQMGQDLPEGNA